MNLSIKFCISIIFLSLVKTSSCQQKQYSTINAKVDSFIRLQLTQNNIAVLSLAVMHEGNIIHSKEYWFANIEHKVPTTANTVYLMASETKTFVAVACR